MCAVSMVVDHYKDQNPFDAWPKLDLSQVSRQEFNQLQEQVSEIHKALEAAGFLDKVLEQPDCVEEKNIKDEFMVKLGEIENQISKLRELYD